MVTSKHILIIYIIILVVIQIIKTEADLNVSYWKTLAICLVIQRSVS